MSAKKEYIKDFEVHKVLSESLSNLDKALSVLREGIRVKDKKRNYYHCTPYRQSMEKIKVEGLRPNIQNPLWQDAELLKPMRDFVYLATTPELCYQYLNHNKDKEPLGYLFVINGKDLKDLSSDEDILGELVLRDLYYNYPGLPSWFGKKVLTKVSIEEINEIGDDPILPIIYDLGKKIHSLFSETEHLKLIDVWEKINGGVTLTHRGPVKVSEIWEVQKGIPYNKLVVSLKPILLGKNTKLVKRIF